MSIFAKVWNCLTGFTWRSEALEVVNSTYTEEELHWLQDQLAMTRARLADSRWDNEILRLALIHAAPDAQEREIALNSGTWAACGSSFEEASDKAWQEYYLGPAAD